MYCNGGNGTCRFMVFDFDNHDKGAEEKDFANSLLDIRFACQFGIQQRNLRCQS